MAGTALAPARACACSLSSLHQFHTPRTVGPACARATWTGCHRPSVALAVLPDAGRNSSSLASVCCCCTFEQMRALARILGPGEPRRPPLGKAAGPAMDRSVARLAKTALGGLAGPAASVRAAGGAVQPASHHCVAAVPLLLHADDQGARFSRYRPHLQHYSGRAQWH